MATARGSSAESTPQTLDEGLGGLGSIDEPERPTSSNELGQDDPDSDDCVAGVAGTGTGIDQYRNIIYMLDDEPDPDQELPLLNEALDSEEEAGTPLFTSEESDHFWDGETENDHISGEDSDSDNDSDGGQNTKPQPKPKRDKDKDKDKDHDGAAANGNDHQETVTVANEVAAALPGGVPALNPSEESNSKSESLRVRQPAAEAADHDNEGDVDVEGALVDKPPDNAAAEPRGLRIAKGPRDMAPDSVVVPGCGVIRYYATTGHMTAHCEVHRIQEGIDCRRSRTVKESDVPS